MRTVMWALIVAAVLGVIFGTGGSNDKESADPLQQRTTQTSEPRAATKPKTAEGRLRAALKGDKAKLEITSDEIAVTFPTPEGGLDGASTGDLNDQAAETFRAIYGIAGFARKSVIVFKGGLVNSETGEDLPDVNTGIFSMSKAKAKRIDWSDEDVWRYTIDWTLYRDFVHPALKQDDG